MNDREHERREWSEERLGEESSYEGETETKRRLRRGDETKGDADDRDIAGAPGVGETPEGREDRSGTRIGDPSLPLREPGSTAPGEIAQSEPGGNQERRSGEKSEADFGD